MRPGEWAVRGNAARNLVQPRVRTVSIIPPFLCKSWGLPFLPFHCPRNHYTRNSILVTCDAGAVLWDRVLRLRISYSVSFFTGQKMEMSILHRRQYEPSCLDSIPFDILDDDREFPTVLFPTVFFFSQKSLSKNWEGVGYVVVSKTRECRGRFVHGNGYALGTSVCVCTTYTCVYRDAWQLAAQCIDDSIHVSILIQSIIRILATMNDTL